LPSGNSTDSITRTYGTARYSSGVSEVICAPL
jgi:hypothetical protein